MGSAATTDLRQGLRERLASLDAGYEAAKDRRAQRVRAADDQFRVETQQLQEERELVAKLLDIEERRHVDEIPEAPPSPHFSYAKNVADFIVTALRGTGPRSKDQIREIANDAGYRVNGRMVHATVLNLVRASRIIEVAEGLYGIPPAPGEFNLTGRLT